MSETKIVSQTTFGLTSKETFLLRRWALNSFAGMFMCSTTSVEHLLRTRDCKYSHEKDHFHHRAHRLERGANDKQINKNIKILLYKYKINTKANIAQCDKCYGETQSRVKIQKDTGCYFSQGDQETPLRRHFIRDQTEVREPTTFMVIFIFKRRYSVIK